MADLTEFQKEWGLYFAYNLPLQLWREQCGGTQVCNFMPRKEYSRHIDTRVKPEHIAEFCEETAKHLENLANLMRMYGRGEIDSISYHNETPEEALEFKREFDEDDERIRLEEEENAI